MFVLLQCGQCRTIVGESPEWLCAIRELDLAVLASTPIQAVEIATETKTVSTSGAPDEGSKYRVFSCSHCSRELGRFYTRVAKIDRLAKETFSFDVGSVLFYSVNSRMAINTDTDSDLAAPTYRSDPLVMDRLDKLERLVVQLYTQSARNSVSQRQSPPGATVRAVVQPQSTAEA